MIGEQRDLFDNPVPEPPARYPDAPGWKENDTSREAAEAIAPRVGRLQALVYAFLQEHPGYTADEIADAIGEDFMAIRPRVSELRKMGRIAPDGRGLSRSNKACHTWKVV